MIISMYAIRDKYTGFMSPMLDQNDETAKRNFSYMVNNNNNGVLAFRPSDFDLYNIGSYDQEKGTVIPISPIEFIINGAALIGENDE